MSLPRLELRWPRLLIGLRPRWLQHIANHTVLEDDQVFLHWQERTLAAAGGSARFEQACFLPSSADVYVSALHRWVTAHGGVPFAIQPPGPRLGPVPLMERFEAHTRHCRSCREAHERIVRWRPRLLTLAALLPLLALAAAPLLASPPAWLPLAGLAAGALALIAERRLAGWQGGLERGSGHPPRNRS